MAHLCDIYQPTLALRGAAASKKKSTIRVRVRTAVQKTKKDADRLCSKPSSGTQELHDGSTSLRGCLGAAWLQRLHIMPQFEQMRYLLQETNGIRAPRKDHQTLDERSH